MRSTAGGFRRLRAAAGALALALVVLPLSSAAASPTGTAQISNIQLGPLQADNGYRVRIMATCSKTDDFAQVEFSKGGHHYRITHYYSDAGRHATSCSVSKRLGSGSLRLSWGRAVWVRLRLGNAGSVHRSGHRGGCGGGVISHERKATATGTMRVSIHTRSFGRLLFHSVPAHLVRFTFAASASVLEKCRQPSLGGAASLFGGWLKGRTARIVSGYVSPAGRRWIYVNAPDNVSKRIGGQLSDGFTGGKRLFSFSSDLSSARIGGFKPFLIGTARYEATSACSQGITNGTLRGKLVLRDPISGKVRFFGSRASFVDLMRLSQRC